jgi:hypothetical protein
LIQQGIKKQTALFSAPKPRNPKIKTGLKQPFRDLPQTFISQRMTKSKKKKLKGCHWSKKSAEK